MVVLDNNTNEAEMKCYLCGKDLNDDIIHISRGCEYRMGNYGFVIPVECDRTICDDCYPSKKSGGTK